MREMIGFCGLDCEKCQARIATKNNDDKLRKQVADEWSKLNGILITPEMINCDGCRVNGVKTPFCDKLCTIRQCALKNEKRNVRRLLASQHLRQGCNDNCKQQRSVGKSKMQIIQSNLRRKIREKSFADFFIKHKILNEN